MSGIELADAIRNLRAELIKANAEADHDILTLELSKIELELKITAQESVEGKAGVKWIVNFETAAHVNTESVQTLKLTLNPKSPSGESFDISDSPKSRPK